MAFKLADGIREQSTSPTGTGASTTSGAVSGYKTFASFMAIGDTTWLTRRLGSAFETGLFQYTAANTLTPVAIFESTNNNAPVSWSAGVKDIFCDQPASRAMAFYASLKGRLVGLGLSVTPSTTFNVAAGAAADETGADMIWLQAAMSKTTAAWAVGGGNGALDTGSIGAGWYHAHLIKRPDTGLVDLLLSLSATAPNLPANYTLSRRLGSLYSSGGLVAMYQVGDHFSIGQAFLDVAASSVGTAAVLRTLFVPVGVSVIAKIHARNTTSSAEAVTFSDPNEADLAAGFNTSQVIANTSLAPMTSMQIRTNISGQIRTRSYAGTAGETLYINTVGWIDRRGQD